jgi:hypothetical protein
MVKPQTKAIILYNHYNCTTYLVKTLCAPAITGLESGSSISFLITAVTITVDH